MFGYDWPRFHAAVNDLPAALLFVTVLFDLGGWLTRRESLKAAALWTLWAGVLGGWVAVLAGLQAEDVIEHGEAIHELMETHETLALTTMGLFTVVLAWKLVRRVQRSAVEETVLRVLSLAGFVTVLWTGWVGGKMAFEHAAGSSTATLWAELKDRQGAHHHHPGEADEEGHEHADSTRDSSHTHAPPHKH
jgi:uncharacterized membrane protein